MLQKKLKYYIIIRCHHNIQFSFLVKFNARLSLIKVSDSVVSMNFSLRWTQTLPSSAYITFFFWWRTAASNKSEKDYSSVMSKCHLDMKLCYILLVYKFISFVMVYITSEKSMFTTQRKNYLINTGKSAHVPRGWSF